MLLCVHVWDPSIEVQALQSMLHSQITLGFTNHYSRRTKQHPVNLKDVLMAV